MFQPISQVIAILVPVIVMRHIVYLLRTIGVILVRVLNHQFLPAITTLLTEMWIKLQTIHALRTIVSMVILCVTFQSISKRTRSKTLGGLPVMSDAVCQTTPISQVVMAGTAKRAWIAGEHVFGKIAGADLRKMHMEIRIMLLHICAELRKMYRATRQTTQFNSETTLRFAWTN